MLGEGRISIEIISIHFESRFHSAILVWRGSGFNPLAYAAVSVVRHHALQLKAGP
jgi:hypothetical protein